MSDEPPLDIPPSIEIQMQIDGGGELVSILYLFIS